MKVKAPTSVVGISCDFFTPKKRAFCEFLGHVYWKSSGNDQMVAAILSDKDHKE